MTRSRGVWIAGIFAIVSGVSEIITGFRHQFFGITTSELELFTYASALIGALYVSAGILILAGTRRAIAVALILLAFDFVGRIALVATGLYPMTTPRNAFAFVAGTALVVVVGFYVWWHFLREPGSRRP